MSLPAALRDNDLIDWLPRSLYQGRLLNIPFLVAIEVNEHGEREVNQLHGRWLLLEGIEFVGHRLGLVQALTCELPDDWTHFNRNFVPCTSRPTPRRSRWWAAWRAGRSGPSPRLKEGDVVLCPIGKGSYLVGRIAGGYSHAPGQILPHRRAVTWLDKSIPRSTMSRALRNSTGSIGTICNVTKYQNEIEELLGS
jgi:restriction system protein